MKKLLQKFKKNKKGFTLVELIIVIAIIAILAAVLAPQYLKYIDKSRWAKDQSNANTLLSEVQTAIVSAGDAGKEVATGATVTMNATNTTISGDTGSVLTDALNEIDVNWSTTKVTNQGKAAGSAVPHEQYVITVQSNGNAKGEWKDARSGS